MTTSQTHAVSAPTFWKSRELFISLAIGGVILALQAFGLFERFELSTLDMRFHVRGTVLADTRVRFVEMAEDSIAAIGRWPWSRDYHATLVSILQRHEPAAIVFDVLFTEPSQSAEMDALFSEAMEKADNVYLPFLTEDENGSASERLIPIEPLRKFERGTGHIDVRPDMDGVVRRVPLVLQRNGEYLPQLSLQVAMDYLGVGKEGLSVAPGKWVELRPAGKPPIRIPVDARCQMLLNWPGRWVDTFDHVSYYETLLSYKQAAAGERPVLDLESFRGKICLIGLTAAGLFDTKPVPFETLYPMVGVHGTLLSNILQGFFIRTAPWYADWVLTLLFALAVGGLVYCLGPLKGALGNAILLAGGAVAAQLLFRYQGLVVAVVAPAIASVFSYAFIVLYKFVVEERKKRWIKNVFSHYLSPSVLDEVLRNPAQLKLGGERYMITVLFSDIRNFTAFTESRPPEEVVQMLNEYLDAMTKVVLDNKGTIDKFVGDEVMALFGAPNRMPAREQAFQAVKAALEMKRALAVLHSAWREQGKPLLTMGIGINTGEMICGNMGSTQIFDYTVIGDNVNIGARVQALTRQYDSDIIITESTYELLAGQADAVKLDSIVMKGKTKPVTIYAVRSLGEGRAVFAGSKTAP